MPLPGVDRLRPYLVFARHDKEPVVRQVGEVQAATEADAVIFAHTLYNERRWQEMFVVPGSAVVPLVRPE